MYNFYQQDYGDFLHNQQLSETASSYVLGSRMNQTVVSNISKIFIVPTIPANRKEVQPGWDLDYALKDEFIQENFALIRTLK